MSDDKKKCIYIAKKGKSIGQACGKGISAKSDSEYCTAHTKQMLKAPKAEKKTKETKESHEDTPLGEEKKAPSEATKPPVQEEKKAEVPLVVTRKAQKIDPDVEVIDLKKEKKKAAQAVKKEEEAPLEDDDGPLPDEYYDGDDDEEEIPPRSGPLGETGLTDEQMKKAQDNFTKEQEQKKGEDLTLLEKRYLDIDLMDDNQAEIEIGNLYNKHAILHINLPPQSRGEQEPKLWLKAMERSRREVGADAMILVGAQAVLRVTESVVAPLVGVQIPGYTQHMLNNKSFLDILMEIKEEHMPTLMNISPTWKMIACMGAGMAEVYAINKRETPPTAPMPAPAPVGVPVKNPNYKFDPAMNI